MNNEQIIRYLQMRPADEINHAFTFIRQETADEAEQHDECVSMDNMVREVTKVYFDNGRFYVSRLVHQSTEESEVEWDELDRMYDELVEKIEKDSGLLL